MRFRHRLLAFFCPLCLGAGLSLGLPVEQARAADQAEILQGALGSKEPFYKASPAALAAAVKACASHDPSHAGGFLALILDSGRNDADAIAPTLVKAAIEGLGIDPKPRLNVDAAAIVRAAVTAAPTEALDIVTEAVKAAPHSPDPAAPAIVAAAIGAVPHPERLVTIGIQRRAERTYSNDKQNDFKQFTDGKSLSAGAEKQLTLAEAIIQAALDADPGLTADSLTAAADSSLGATFATSEGAVLTGVLPPVAPILPNDPSITGGGSTPVFTAPGPVSP